MGATCGGGCGCAGAGAKFDGPSRAYRRRLRLVIAMNAAMFGVETIAGALAGSRALQADALDFLGDAPTYGLSLVVIGMPLRARADAAPVEGASLAAPGLRMVGATLRSVFFLGQPAARVMGVVGFAVLATNPGAAALLAPYKDGDANVRSVWLCSRDDAIGNVAPMGAALLVRLTASGWPDVIVAGAMAALFLNSAAQILRQALAERRAVVAA